MLIIWEKNLRKGRGKHWAEDREGRGQDPLLPLTTLVIWTHHWIFLSLICTIQYIKLDWSKVLCGPTEDSYLHEWTKKAGQHWCIWLRDEPCTYGLSHFCFVIYLDIISALPCSKYWVTLIITGVYSVVILAHFLCLSLESLRTLSSTWKGIKLALHFRT